MPTIITTNLDITKFENPENIAQRRIYSRILEMCPIKIFVDNKNNRQEKANIKTNIAKKNIK